MAGIKYDFQLTGAQKAAADIGAVDNALKKLGVTFQNASESFKKLNPGAFGAAGGSPLSIMPNWYMAQAQLFSKRMGSLGTPGIPPLTPIRLPTDKFLAQAASSAAAMGPLFRSQAINWRMAGLGALAAPFSPWIGARALSSAFGPALAGGGGGGAGGKITSAIFGAGGMPLFIAAFAGIRLAIEAVTGALHKFLESVREGARLFQSAARIGRSPGATAGLEGSLGSVGISVSGIEQLMIKGEYPNRSGRSLMSSGEMLSAWKGVLPTGQLQQIQNLSQYIDLFSKNMGGMAQVMGENAKTAFDVEFAWKQFTFTFEAGMSEIVRDLGPALIAVLKEFTEWMKGFIVLWRVLSQLSGLSDLLKLADRFNQATGAVPGDVAKFKSGMIGSHIMPNLNQFQRMGFVMAGQGGGNDYARQTADNTREIADLMKNVPRALLLKVPTGPMNMP